MVWLLAFIAILALGCMLCAEDERAPRERDPFRLDRWRAGEAEEEE